MYGFVSRLCMGLCLCVCVPVMYGFNIQVMYGFVSRLCMGNLLVLSRLSEDCVQVTFGFCVRFIWGLCQEDLCFYFRFTEVFMSGLHSSFECHHGEGERGCFRVTSEVCEGDALRVCVKVTFTFCAKANIAFCV